MNSIERALLKAEATQAIRDGASRREALEIARKHAQRGVWAHLYARMETAVKKGYMEDDAA